MDDLAQYDHTFNDGTRMTGTEFRDYVRAYVLLEHKVCPTCAKPLPVTLYGTGSEAARGAALDAGDELPKRGTRLDKRYCSNACRQRAYRQRRQSASRNADE
jgi:hypothetical protein